MARNALTLADWLSVSRMTVAVVVVPLAILHLRFTVLALAIIGFLLDALDGPVARAMNQATPRGAKFDSVADVMLVGSLSCAVIFLFPEQMQDHLTSVLVLLSSWVVPIAVGWLKFRKLTSYHTIGARLALVSVALGVPLWLLLGWTTALHTAAIITAISALEELAITVSLDAPVEDVQHFRRALRLRAASMHHAVSTRPHST